MKKAFVTGANRGIGKGFSDYLLDQGYRVYAGVRDLDSIKSDNQNLVPIKSDISDDDSIRSAFEKIKETTSCLDILVNNAGMNKDSATNGHKELVCNLKDLDRDSINKMFDVNATSPLMVIKHFVSLLTGNPSYVINISSGRASTKDEYSNSTGNYGYCSSKAALNRLVSRVIVDLPENIKTFAVHPGGVKTDMNPNGEHNPYDQAEKMVNITKEWKEEYNGAFLRYNGMFYPV